MPISSPYYESKFKAIALVTRFSTYIARFLKMPAVYGVNPVTRQRNHARAQTRKTLVLSQTLPVAGVNLLYDNGIPEQAKDVMIQQIRYVAATAVGVAVGKFPAGKVAGEPGQIK